LLGALRVMGAGGAVPEAASHPCQVSGGRETASAGGKPANATAAHAIKQSPQRRCQQGEHCARRRRTIMIAHASVFDPLHDGELAELKAHVADWVAEAARADQSRGNLASWQLSGNSTTCSPRCVANCSSAKPGGRRHDQPDLVVGPVRGLPR